MKCKTKKRIIAVTVSVVVVFSVLFFVYISDYCRADETALSALRSDENITVIKTDYGYFFDGKGTTEAFIFYPGGKVEETAYAPLMSRIAEEGIDVCLLKMPLRLAFFDIDKADMFIQQTNYEHYYIGGHSLGGVAASYYLKDNDDKIDGIIFCASYPVKAVPENKLALSIYGSLDNVLDFKEYEKAKKYFHENYKEFVLDGANHSGFGNYGVQKGDNDAEISNEEQQRKTAEIIFNEIKQ